MKHSPTSPYIPRRKLGKCFFKMIKGCISRSKWSTAEPMYFQPDWWTQNSFFCPVCLPYCLYVRKIYGRIQDKNLNGRSIEKDYSVSSSCLFCLACWLFILFASWHLWICGVPHTLNTLLLSGLRAWERTEIRIKDFQEKLGYRFWECEIREDRKQSCSNIPTAFTSDWEIIRYQKLMCVETIMWKS